MTLQNVKSRLKKVCLKLAFIVRCSYASLVLGVVILSVCLSVCHTHALWQNQTTHCGYFDTTRKGNHSSFLTPTVVGGQHSLPSEICAQIDPPPSKNSDCDRFPLISTVREESKRSPTVTNSKSRAFERAINVVHMLLLTPPKGWLKKRFI